MMKRWLLMACVMAAMSGGWLSRADAADELTFATPVDGLRVEACEACDGCRCESREARSRPVARWVTSNQTVRRVTRIAGRVAVGVLPGR
ncbi:MAG: hypothetical protein ACKPEY_01645 [Planctomycetota bacterium]